MALRFLAATMLACLWSAVALGAPVQAVETVIQDDALLLHRPAAEVRKTAQRIAGLGVDRVRLTASWATLAPAPDALRRPEFDATDSRQYPPEPFAKLDRAVREVRRAGIETMVDLAFFAPRWAVAVGGDGGRNVSRPSPREFGRFARAVAERYSGRFTDPLDRRRNLPAVRLWTTWNEPNHPVFLRPQWERVPAATSGERSGRRTARGATTWRPASPHLYRRMHNAAYDQVKAVDPSNRVLVGGLAAEAEPGAGALRGVGPLLFTRELACVDSALKPLRRPECQRFRPLRADGFAHHPYSRFTKPDARDLARDRVQIGELDRLTTLLAALHQRGRLATPLPLYITEYGYETNPPDPRGHTPEDHARYLGQATYLAWRQPEVQMFAQFLLQDIGPKPGLPADSPARWADYQTGLYHHDGRPKDAVLQAFRLPFFVETVTDAAGATHTVAFGQVRPRSGPQTVIIQRRPSLGRWLSEATMRLLPPGTPQRGRFDFKTDAQGFFQRQLPFRPGETYRAIWTAGNRFTAFSQEVNAGTPRLISGELGALTRQPR